MASAASRVEGAVKDQGGAVNAIARTAAALHDKAAQVSAQVSDVAGLAEATSMAAHEMLQAADVLGREAVSLQVEAGAFIGSVRAA